MLQWTYVLVGTTVHWARAYLLVTLVQSDSSVMVLLVNHLLTVQNVRQDHTVMRLALNCLS